MAQILSFVLVALALVIILLAVVVFRSGFRAKGLSDFPLAYALVFTFGFELARFSLDRIRGAEEVNAWWFHFSAASMTFLAGTAIWLAGLWARNRISSGKAR